MSFKYNIFEVITKVLIIILLISKVKGARQRPFDINSIFIEKLSRTETDYIECLNRSLETESHSLDPINKTHLVSIGAVLRLECSNLCLRIEESLDNLWVFMSHQNLNLSLRSIKNTKLLKDLSLEVKFRDEADGATYYCIHNSTIYSVHQITVTDREPFDLNFTKSHVNESRVKYLDKHGLQLFTQWSDWSDCNRCPIGLKKRVGICKIRKYKNENLLIDDSFSVSGIPCRSQYLPKQITSMSEIQEKRSQIRFDFCLKQCPNKTRTKISKQKVKNTFIHMKKLIIASDFKIVFIGEKVQISCNTVFNGSQQIIWRNFSIGFTKRLTKVRFYYINPLRIHIRTKGRIKIDFMNNLVINYALKSDQRLYKCYDSINNSTISVTKLVVRSKLKEITLWSSVKQNFSVFLIIVTIISFGFTLWRNRKLKTKI